MTKKEAVELESKIEKDLSKLLKEDVEVSLALSNKLKIAGIRDSSVEVDWYITFTNDGTPDYIKYNGFYDNLENYIKVIKEFLIDNKKDIELLVWSYNHQDELIIEEPKEKKKPSSLFKYYFNNWEVNVNTFDSLFYEALELWAKEDGCYYEWLNEGLPLEEYESLIRSKKFEYLSKLLGNIGELKLINGSYKIELCGD